MRISKAMQFIYFIYSGSCYVRLYHIDTVETTLFREKGINHSALKSILYNDGIYRLMAHISGFMETEDMKELKLDSIFSDPILKKLLDFYIKKGQELDNNIYEKAPFKIISDNKRLQSAYLRVKINPMLSDNLADQFDNILRISNVIHAYYYGSILLDTIREELKNQEIDNSIEYQKDSLKRILLCYAIAVKNMDGDAKYKLFLSTIINGYDEEFNKILGADNLRNLYPSLELYHQRFVSSIHVH